MKLIVLLAVLLLIGASLGAVAMADGGPPIPPPCDPNVNPFCGSSSSACDPNVNPYCGSAAMEGVGPDNDCDPNVNPFC